MSYSLPVSQLSMMKISSTKSAKCTVFYETESSLDKYELQLDQTATVDILISETLKMVKEKHTSLNIDAQRDKMELFASRKNGRKVSDLPSLERQQPVDRTGIKCFFLSDSSQR